MYQDNLATEREGMQTIIDFLTLKSQIPPKPIANDFAQKYLGDLVVFGKTKALFTEVKIEKKASKNFFLETASNAEFLGIPGKGDNALGWLFKCQADVLIYYFIESDELYMVSMPALRHWLLNQQTGTLRNYPEVKARQSGRNDSWARLTPISDLRAAQLDGWWEASPKKELSNAH